MDYIQRMRARIGHDRLLVVGAGVLVHQNGRLLLQKRRDNGCWADHGGCLEPGETCEQTASRELLEETGLAAHALTLVGVFSGEDLFHTYPNGDQVAIVQVMYLCEEYSGDLIPQQEEVAELAWFPVDALPDNISPPSRRAVAACIAYLNRRKSK